MPSFLLVNPLRKLWLTKPAQYFMLQFKIHFLQSPVFTKEAYIHLYKVTVVEVKY